MLLKFINNVYTRHTVLTVGTLLVLILGAYAVQDNDLDNELLQAAIRASLGQSYVPPQAMNYAQSPNNDLTDLERAMQASLNDGNVMDGAQAMDFSRNPDSDVEEALQRLERAQNRAHAMNGIPPAMPMGGDDDFQAAIRASGWEDYLTVRRASETHLVLDQRTQLEAGNKIYLPNSVFRALHDQGFQFSAEQPAMFEVTNFSLPEAEPRSTHCGVLAFEAPDNCCIMPQWMIDQSLLADSGTLLKVRLVPNGTLPQGQFLKLRPHKTAFTDMFADATDFNAAQAVLEPALSGRFCCLTEGDVIALPCQFDSGEQRTFNFDVIEVRGGQSATTAIRCPTISIIDVTLQLDFDPARDAPWIEEKRAADSAALDAELTRLKVLHDAALAEDQGDSLGFSWGQSTGKEEPDQAETQKAGHFSKLGGGHRLTKPENTHCPKCMRYDDEEKTNGKCTCVPPASLAGAASPQSSGRKRRGTRGTALGPKPRGTPKRRCPPRKNLMGKGF